MLKVVVLPQYGGPEVLEFVQDYPDPVPGPDQVVVRMHAAALNHLDLFVREGIPTLKLTLPLILGSDGAGHIASVGSDVTDLEVGDRVVLNPGISCGRCEYCVKGDDSACVDYRILGEHLPGTYAEQVAVPARNALKIPTDLSFKDSVRTLRKGGRVVVPGATTGSMLELDARYLFWRQLSVLGSTMANQREFEEVMKLVFMGRLKPVVDRVFPLKDARAAHEYLGRGEQFGKVVLAIP